jgi:hypothetical protein
MTGRAGGRLFRSDEMDVALSKVLCMRALVVPLLAVAMVGCTSAPLSHTEPSSEALARSVLDALEHRDAHRLQALALSESEFEQRVWPGLPAARPERNMPWTYVWMELRQKSDTFLRRTLSQHGGRRYTLESVRFAGSSTEHGDYRVHREAILSVRDTMGRSYDLKILGSMLETDGGWKVFSYVVDR